VVLCFARGKVVSISFAPECILKLNAQIAGRESLGCRNIEPIGSSVRVQGRNDEMMLPAQIGTAHRKWKQRGYKCHILQTIPVVSRRRGGLRVLHVPLCHSICEPVSDPPVAGAADLAKALADRSPSRAVQAVWSYPVRECLARTRRTSSELCA
jgi:hypothetical protein